MIRNRKSFFAVPINTIFRVAFLLLLPIFGGCEKAGKVRLQFSEVELQEGSTKPIFDNFEIKVFSIAMIDDLIPGTQNTAGMIHSLYSNPECNKVYPYSCGLPGEGKRKEITTFANFTTPSAANLSLAPDFVDVYYTDDYQYRYFDFILCNDTVPSDNVSYTIHGSTPKTGKLRTCRIITAPMDPPIKVEPEKEHVVTLAFDSSDYLFPSVADLGDGLCDDNPAISPAPSTALAGAKYWCVGNFSAVPRANAQK